jgi:hypothetical protein
MRRYRKLGGGAGKRGKVPQYRPPVPPYQPYQEPPAKPRSKGKQRRR